MTDPPGWGKDFLSKYLEAAHYKNKAASVNLNLVWDHLGRICDLFRQARASMTNVQTFFAPHFLIDAFSCYLAGARLATSGQMRPAYMVLRGCLESSLYGLHIAQDEEATGMTWLNRHVDEVNLKAMKNEFLIGNVRKTLARVDPETATEEAMLYQRVIDFGAHPNPYSILRPTSKKNEAEWTTYLEEVFSQDCPAMRLCLKTTAETGLCALRVFRNVWQQRFDILGITDKLLDLRAAKWLHAYNAPSTASRRDSSLRSE